MVTSEHEALSEFFGRYGEHQAVRALADRWQRTGGASTDEGHGKPASTLYDAAVTFVEQEMWASGYPESTLALYQRLYREMESHLARDGNDKRYDFVVVIPVADRPRHLENCLNSLLRLCRLFGYGGTSNGRYNKVWALIADDSRVPANIGRIRKIVEKINRQGLESLYFGQTDQLQQLDRLAQPHRHALDRVIGDHNGADFSHKGASITRNITYLKLNELAKDNDRRLFWFMDSDQEFQVNTGDGDRVAYAINYFHRLDQIFSARDTLVLTGKIVGDPPVSPAVMAGNLLADVTAFLADMEKRRPRQRCRFHGHEIRRADAAAYHDMADLFGYRPATGSSRYLCTLEAPHDHAACFVEFSEKLDRFFDGAHPTRQTHYEYRDCLSNVDPARTVYTGNYVLTAKALQYFIPFATLKLRMAGPVLGRILQAEKDRQFVSANLPVLHRRTIDAVGQSEFRTGIERIDDRIDLAGEFERQFYGDVMLFTIESLTGLGYPGKSLPEPLVRQTLARVESGVRQKYTDRQRQIQTGIGRLKSLFGNRRNWWHQVPDARSARENFRVFIHNIEHNFGEASPGYRMITSASHRHRRGNELFEAVMGLTQDRAGWLEALSAGR